MAGRSIIYPLPNSMRVRQVDHKAMQYFFSFAALDLSGYLPGRFWDCLILQATRSEPLVRQAVLAVSSAHLEYCTTGLTSPESLALYQASVKRLRAYLQDTHDISLELVLLCCILLFTFDRLRGDDALAATHLHSAIAMWNNQNRHLRAGRGPKQITGMSQGAATDIYNILVRLDVEDTFPQLDRGPLLELEIDSPTAYLKDPPTMTFFSTSDFMEPWMQMCHAVWAFLGRNAQYRRVPIDEIPLEVSLHRNDLQRWVEAWHLSYKEYVERVGIPNADETQSAPPSQQLNSRIFNAINALVIESHYFVIRSVLAECLPSGVESDLNAWDQISEELLRCGEEARSLREVHRQINGVDLRKTFSTHVGIVEPLLCLSHRTVYPSVRRRAQNLIGGFRDVSGDLTGVSAFFAGYGAPPDDLVLMYELPGH